MRFAALVLTVMAVVATPPLPASADSTDSGFLADLREINDPSIQTLIDAKPELLIDAAHRTCSMLDQGYGSSAVKGMILDQLPLYGQSSDYFAGLFGVYAVADYCPAHQADSGFNGQY